MLPLSVTLLLTEYSSLDDLQANWMPHPFNHLHPHVVVIQYCSLVASILFGTLSCSTNALRNRITCNIYLHTIYLSDYVGLYAPAHMSKILNGKSSL